MDSQTLLKDFSQALLQLDEALQLDAESDVIKAGCIQYFEFSFELAWKTVKRIAEEDGISECNSPKAALKVAFSNGWINEEDVWLDMLMSRNKMSHTYNAAAALTIYDKLPEYLVALKQLVAQLNLQFLQ
jgi:nucleotidyltransferase substrate binding protein (TIGR01987 family)